MVLGWPVGVLLSVVGRVAVPLVKLAEKCSARQVILPLDCNVLLLVVPLGRCVGRVSLIEFFVEDGVPRLWRPKKAMACLASSRSC